MPADHASLRVFWPTDIVHTSRPGVVVGWRNSQLDVVVVGVLLDVDASSVDSALQMGIMFRDSPHPIERLLGRCGRQGMQVVGVYNSESSTFSRSPIFAATCPRHWRQPPHISWPHDSAVTLQLITFDRPDPHHMQYLSLAPISLSLADATHLHPDEAAAHQVERRMVEKLRLHTIERHPLTDKELALPLIVEQINCSSELNRLLQKNIGLVGSRVKRSLSVSERVVESATDLWFYVGLVAHHAFDEYLYPTISHLFVLGLIGHRLAAEVLLHLLCWRPMPDQAALKDLSATAQQLDIRLQQFCYWPVQYVTLRKRRSDWESITTHHAEYIRFYNSLWLVANDIIIGIALGSYITENADLVASQVDKVVGSWFVQGLQRMIVWLMDYPAGLKLNNDLAAFLGVLFLWVIDYWAGCMRTLRPLLPIIIRFIGLSSFAGASLPVSLFSDLVSLLTLHIYAFYTASARIYSWQLDIIVSLFHLFRGKKQNVLRDRIDSCDYDLDQLLLGTILFTLLTFLLPTIAVFYATFAGARMAIIVLKAALDTWLACLNHFPLFALMLRLKDSGRLPGGVRFELCYTDDAAGSVAHVKLKSVPLSFTQTFSQYAQLGKRIRRHYLSASNFLCLCTGRFIPPIHRRNLYSLQYSMLPASRVPVARLWALLVDGDG